MFSDINKSGLMKVVFGAVLGLAGAILTALGEGELTGQAQANQLPEGYEFTPTSDDKVKNNGK